MNNDRQNEDNGSSFRPHDLTDSQKERKFRRFKRNYRRNQSGEWRDEEVASTEDWKALVDAFASRLALTDYQQKRARKLVDDLPRKHWGANKSAAVALVLCSFVGVEDGRDYHPNQLGENVDMAVEMGVSRDRFLAIWERARQDMEVDL